MGLRTESPNGFGKVRRLAGRSAQLAGGLGLRVWHLLVRNRLAIAIASLFWLIFRSGSQPRRLSYPCQQVAAFNVGAFVAGLIPALFLFKKNRTGPSVPRSIMIRRQIVAAGLLFVGAWLSIEGYQFAQNLTLPEIPAVPARAEEAIPTTVGIAQRDLTQGESFTEAEIELLVRRAVQRAGGLEDVIEAGDWVVLKPNLVQSFWDGSQGVVTDPRVCAAVVKLAWEAGAGQVSIAEGTADGAGANSTWVAYTTSGYDGTDGPSDRYFDYDTNVQLLDLNDAGGKDPNPVQNCQWVELGDNAALRKAPLGYWVPNTVMDCDVFITVPTFKNHSNGTVTLSLKNRVGCPPNDIYHHPSMDTMKWGLVHSTTEGGPDGNGFPSNVLPTPGHEHEIVHRTIVDLNLVRPQDFVVIDGLMGRTAPAPWARWTDRSLASSETASGKSGTTSRRTTLRPTAGRCGRSRRRPGSSALT